MTKSEKFWAAIAFSAIFALIANVAVTFYLDNQQFTVFEKGCQGPSLNRAP
ncbi:hypothetical protein [Burkholderia plantarii]|uniref:hypothetical protein n=1 Tax=Burkholderia plantarii TaxID=41899 RepID=UPI001313DF7B|nr:hypothetical protein [Burkholderia plantarii]